MSKFMSLKQFAYYVDDKIHSSNLRTDRYITTDNLLQNKYGMTQALSLPAQEGNVTRFKKGDTLIANIRPYLKKIWLATFDGGCSADVLAIRPKRGIDCNFLFYALFRDDFFIHAMNGVKGTKMPRGDKNQIMDFIIPNLCISTQSKIVNALTALDQKIELNNHINAELEAMAKTLYDYWFVQFDFPDEKGRPYKSSGGKMVYNKVLKRKIPEGWKDGTASDLFIFNPSILLKVGESAVYIDMESLPTTGYMTKPPLKRPFTGGMKFMKNDVAIARITPCLENGKTCLLSRLEENGVGFGSTEFIILRGKDALLPSFAANFARSASFRHFAILNMTGTSGRKRIDAKILEAYSMAIPPIKLLNNFESRTASLFEKMTLNAEECDRLATIRNWLLPMLMNGQVKVG